MLFALGQFSDPALFLARVMSNDELDMRLRLDAAKSLLPYAHERVVDVGKKEQRKQAAAVVITGRFRPSKPPRG